MKRQVMTSLSPFEVLSGADVLYEHALAALEQLNWSHGHRPITHLNMAVGPTDAAAYGTLHWLFVSTEWVRRALYTAVVDDDVLEQTVSAICEIDGSDVCDVRFVIGAGVVDLIGLTAADGDVERVATISTTETGTGVLTCEVWLRRREGSGYSYPVCISHQDSPILDASLIPDPADD